MRPAAGIDEAVRRCGKSVQRQAFSALRSRVGVAVAVVVGLLATESVLRWLDRLVGAGVVSCPQPAREPADNIAGRDFDATVCPEPIDLVYTWVNGSDPWMQANLLHYKYGEDWADPGRAANLDNAAGASRFEDHDELLYSIRSVERFAPWVRHIYVVTNGQVPRWLNVEHPRVTVVPHHDLFPRPLELPTFSSPSIEAHLHRIPGLSSRFLYLNDDTFFGNEVWPEDFWTHAGGQRIWLSWPVPDCADQCSSSWVGDGYCDKQCNTTACGWDGGDCIGSKVRMGFSSAEGESGGYRSGGQGGQSGGIGGGQGGDLDDAEPEDQCEEGCADSAIGTGMCDAACNVAECGYDVLDCGTAGIDSLWSVPAGAQSHTVPSEIGAFVINLTGRLDRVEGGMHTGGTDGVVRTVVLAQARGLLVLAAVLRPEYRRTAVSIEVSGTRLGKSRKLRYNLTVGDPEAQGYDTDSSGVATYVSVVDLTAAKAPQWGDGDMDASSRPRRVVASAHLRRKLLAAKVSRRRQERLWQATGIDSSRTRRRLLDTFGDSLKFVNRLMDARFSKEQRRVPSHMPHLIDKQVVEEMQGNWPDEFAATSKARFRSGTDMQFAFTHAYWVMHARNAKSGVYFFETKLDLDGDGYLQPREVRRMAAMLWESSVTLSELQQQVSRASPERPGGGGGGAEVDGSFSLGARTEVKDDPRPDPDFPPLAGASSTTRRRLLGLPQWATDWSDEDGLSYDSPSVGEYGGWEGGYGSDCHNETVWVTRNGTDYPEIKEVCDGGQRYDWTPEPSPADELAGIGPPYTAEYLSLVTELVDIARAGRKVDSREDAGRSWSSLLTALYFNGSHLAEILMKGDLEHRYKFNLAPDGDESGVAFLMAANNATVVRRKLDRVSVRRPKFICINDNMNHSADGVEEVVAAVQSFLSDYFPRRSSFERAGGSNSFAHTWTAPQQLRRQLRWTDPRKAGLEPGYAATFAAPPAAGLPHHVVFGACSLALVAVIAVLLHAARRGGGRAAPVAV